MSHLAEKAKELAERTKKATADTDAMLDEKFKKLAAVEARRDDVMHKHDAVLNDVDQGTSMIEEVNKNLTN